MAEILDDIAKFGNNALTAMNSLQRQVRKWASEQADYAVKSMDIVTQEELDVQKIALEKRIKELEDKVAALSGKSSPAAKTPKSAAKKATKTTPKKKATVKKKSIAKKKTTTAKASPTAKVSPSAKTAGTSKAS